MPEVICINVGQAGIQMANASWELFCIEHGVEATGKLRHQVDEGSCGFRTFFQEVPSGNYVPRAINIDLEPTVIDEIRLASYRHLWHPDYLINCCEDAANNFARGHFTVGKSVIETFMDRLRKCVHACERLQGFIVLNSYGGGTGSGLSALIFENIDIEFSKTTKFQQCIYPSPQLATAIVEPYNAVLCSSMSMDHTDVTMLIDNEATFEICSRKLAIARPMYSNINRLIAQVFSSLTVSIRFGSSLSHDLTQLQTNLVPYPRIHYPVVNYAPIFDAHRATHETMSVTEITRELFSQTNQLVKCDMRGGKYMSCCIQYRGLITPRQVNVSVYDIKKRADINFVEWCPTGFKLGICPMPPACVPGSEMANTNRNCSMYCNTSAIVQLWERLNKKFDLLFHKRAFVHWYVGEGMEEGEFIEAKNDITSLEKDYIEVAMNSDEYSLGTASRQHAGEVERNSTSLKVHTQPETIVTERNSESERGNKQQNAIISERNSVSVKSNSVKKELTHDDVTLVLTEPELRTRSSENVFSSIKKLNVDLNVDVVEKVDDSLYGDLLKRNFT